MQHDIGVRHTPLVTFTDAMKASLNNLEGVYFALIFGDRDIPYPRPYTVAIDSVYR